MSVSVSIQLPEDPVAEGADAGFVDFVPLAGDGYVDPQSAYQVYVALDSDASGGHNQIAVNLDPQYTSLVQTVDLRVNAASAAVAFQLLLSRTRPGGVMSEMFGGSAAFSSPSSGQARATQLWQPPPFINPDIVTGRVANTDTESLNLLLNIYNFRKGAQFIAPLSDLFRVLRR